MNPWVIQARASRFFNFVGGYSIFLGPLVGSKPHPLRLRLHRSLTRLLVILCDYLIIRKATPYNIYHLYRPGGLYWYWKGCNFRALTAWLVGVAPLLPGLIYNINSNIKMDKGILEFYTLGWLDGLVIAS
jgi:nucleobase:cation symporter-1, NCS1 family